ncbi:MAG: TetR family transcriptional regulator [Alphaproteobacteria bacterium]|nr:TetR family transcriptional regulator [Alphaproteobacteria bacterium]
MSPRHLPAHERRQRTIEAVVSLAGTMNPSDVTTGAIAEHMSVTQGALFRHFPSKDSIFEAVMQWVAERLLDRVDQAASRASSPLSALEAMFTSHIAFAVEYPGVSRMMFGELQRLGPSPAKAVAKELLRCYAARLAGKLDSAKAAGDVRSDTNTQAAALLFIGTIQGLVMQSMISGDLSAAKRSAPDVFRIYRRGIEAEHAEADGGDCNLNPGCRLKSHLKRAEEAFLSDLDRSTLADCVGRQARKPSRTAKRPRSTKVTENS